MNIADTLKSLDDDIESLDRTINAINDRHINSSVQNEDIFSELEKVKTSQRKRWNELQILQSEKVKEMNKNWSHESEIQSSINEINNDLKILKEKESDLNAELETIEESRSLVAQATKEALTEALEIAQQALFCNPRDASINDLLRHIVPIKWNKPAHEDGVSGTVFTKSGFKSFNFNLKEVSKSKITEELWKLLGDCNTFSTK